MLSQLVSYTRQKGLGAEPGFTTKEIRWLVGVSPQGTFTELIPLDNQAKTAPDLLFAEMIGMPNALKSMGYPAEQAAHFLADTCAVVFGLAERDVAGNPKKPEEHAKNLQKQATFRLLMELAAQQVPLLKPIAQALSDPEQMRQFLGKLEAQAQKRGAEKLKPTDKVSFWVQGRCVLDFPDWHDWWRQFRARAFPKSDTQGRMPSFASGELVTPASTHPKVTNLGGSAFGHALVTYDKEAFESYGLAQGENAAVEEPAATAYRAGLDALLAQAQTLGEMKVVVWYDREIPPEDDLFQDLFEPTSAEAGELQALERARGVLEAIRTGKMPPDVSHSHYFATAMSPASGRVMVRDWQTGSLEDFVEAVEAWFADLTITTRGGGNARLPGLNRLLLSLQRPKAPETRLDDYIKPIKMLQIPLWRAALNPKNPIPYAAIAKVMESHSASVVTGEFDEAIKAQKPDAAGLGRIYARMGLLKAYHNRKGGYRMIPALDPNHPSKAYHCGRLMCLLAQVQETSAEAEINAGVVQRYYGAASSTPALVLGRLTRLSQHHLSKIAKDSPGLAFWLNNQLAEVWNALGKELPRTLSLEEQSLFALGYYQQMAYNRTKRSGNPQASEESE